MRVSHFLRVTLILSIVTVTSQSQAKTKSSTMVQTNLTSATAENANILVTTTMTTTTTRTTAKPDRFINLSALSALTSFSHEPEIKERTKNTCRSTDMCTTMQGMCNNGKCVPMPCSEFECKCEPGYVGQFCDREAHAKKTSKPEPSATTTATSGPSSSVSPVNTNDKTHVNGEIGLTKNEVVVSKKEDNTNLPATSKSQNENQTTSKYVDSHVSKDVSRSIPTTKVTHTSLESKKDSQVVVVSDKTSVQDHRKSSDVKRINNGIKGRDTQIRNSKTRSSGNVEAVKEHSKAISTTTDISKSSFRKGKEAVVLVDKTAIYVKNTSEVLKAGPTTVVTETNAVVQIEKQSWQSRIFGIPPKGVSIAIKSDMPKASKRNKSISNEQNGNSTLTSI